MEIPNFYRTQVSRPVRSMGRVVSNKLTFWYLTDDVTLADIETNLILTDKVNRVIQGNAAMQVTQPGGQPSNFGSDVTWWPNFDPICNKSEDAYLNEMQIRF